MVKFLEKQQEIPCLPQSDFFAGSKEDHAGCIYDFISSSALLSNLDKWHMQVCRQQESQIKFAFLGASCFFRNFIKPCCFNSLLVDHQAVESALWLVSSSTGLVSFKLINYDPHCLDS